MTNKVQRSRDIVVVDVESDGPVPPLYSMVSFGAVLVRDREIVGDGFYGFTAPLAGASWDAEALAVSGYTREEHVSFQSAATTMQEFAGWVDALYQPLFVADNNGFDWGFINYYFHRFVGRNPFGFSSTNLNSLYKGVTHDMRNSVRRLRTTKHDHNPLHDAMGNAEALIKIAQKYEIVRL